MGNKNGGIRMPKTSIIRFLQNLPFSGFIVKGNFFSLFFSPLSSSCEIVPKWEIKMVVYGCQKLQSSDSFKIFHFPDSLLRAIFSLFFFLHCPVRVKLFQNGK